MTTQAAMDTGTIRERMVKDHERLDALFRDVLGRLALDDRDETRAAWNDFEQGLVRHLDAEEKLVLPAFALVFPDEAKRIVADHDHFRARLLELGVAVDLHTIRVDVATDFIHELREHAAREDALLYRWADQNLEEAVRTALIRGLLTRV